MAEKILIVDDEDTLRESLKRVLQREGYEVDSVDSSEAALRTITDKHYDLVISDIILPGLSGMELLKKCRARNPLLTVIIITAFATIETAVEAIRAGAYEYLVKPIQHEDFKAIVQKALNEKIKGKI